MLEKIKIGWKEYKIEHSKVKSTLVVEGSECYGQISYDDQVIYLREGNTEEQDRATLIHEALHGISDMYYLKLDEETVTRLGDALYTVIKDNQLSLTGEYGQS